MTRSTKTARARPNVDAALMPHDMALIAAITGKKAYVHVEANVHSAPINPRLPLETLMIPPIPRLAGPR